MLRVVRRQPRALCLLAASLLRACLPRMLDARLLLRAGGGFSCRNTFGNGLSLCTFKVDGTGETCYRKCKTSLGRMTHTHMLAVVPRLGTLQWSVVQTPFRI